MFIKSASFSFNFIKIDWDSLSLEYVLLLGGNFISDKINIKENLILNSNNKYGIKTIISILNLEYILFFTSYEIDNKIRSILIDPQNLSETIDTQYYAEFDIDFELIKIFFLRRSNQLAPDIMSTVYNQLNSEKFIDGFYYPISNRAACEYILINFSSDLKTLIKLKEKKLKSFKTNILFNILINKIKLGKSKYYAYIISIIDLITINKLSNNQPTFIYNNKILPIPSLPKINFEENLINNNDFITVQVSRSEVLVLVTCNGSSITELFDNENFSDKRNKSGFDYIFIDNERIKVFNSYLPKSLQIGRKCQYRDFNFYSACFPQFDDFDEFLCSIEELLGYHRHQKHLEEAGLLLDDDRSEYPDYWDSLDTSEKFEDNYDLAEQYFSEPNRDSEDDDPLDDYYERLYSSKPAIKSLLDSPEFLDFEEKLYDKNLSVFEWLKTNLHCIYINDQLVTFEYFVDDLYQNHICFLNPVIFINGIKVFSTYLSIPTLGELNIFIIQKPINIDISFIVKEVKQFNDCFHIEYPGLLVLVKKVKCIMATDVKLVDKQDNLYIPDSNSDLPF